MVSNFMVHYAWMLHYGMDFTEQNHPYINSEELWPAHRFFNRHIHDKHVELAAGGFSYFRQQLDSADKVLWPEEEFGKAKISNMGRMVAIAEWNFPNRALAKEIQRTGLGPSQTTGEHER